MRRQLTSPRFYVRLVSNERIVVRNSGSTGPRSLLRAERSSRHLSATTDTSRGGICAPILTWGLGLASLVLSVRKIRCEVFTRIALLNPIVAMLEV